jgi:hypothetical protein
MAVLNDENAFMMVVECLIMFVKSISENELILVMGFVFSAVPS